MDTWMLLCSGLRAAELHRAGAETVLPTDPASQRFWCELRCFIIQLSSEETESLIASLNRRR